MQEESGARHTGTRFMLKEYDRLGRLRAREENQCEQRVSFFLTITSAAVGAAVLLVQTGNMYSKQALSATQGLLFVLLLFGLTISNRLNSRTSKQRAYVELMNEIQEYFVVQDSGLRRYLELQNELLHGPSPPQGVISLLLGRLRGTLTDFMALSNAVLCGGIVFTGLVRSRRPNQVAMGWAIAAGLVLVPLLYVYHHFLPAALRTYS